MKREPDIRPSLARDAPLFAGLSGSPPRKPPAPPSGPPSPDEQPDGDDEPDDRPDAPYARRSDTSRRAAARKRDASADRSRVLAYIAAQGARGATTDEIEAALSLRHQNASARVWELSGRDRKRPWLLAIAETPEVRLTRSGRPAHVYVLLPPVVGQFDRPR